MWRLLGRRHLATAVASVAPAARHVAGDVVAGNFVVKATRTVPLQRLTATLLTHQPTGAEHLHIDRVDSNKAFNVIFKTVPTDSTGVPHILEHTTLCGSRKYPVRDPFFKMLNRSLATFMNAMTGNDYTMYPFASQNWQDYRNLLSVYLDATFFPQLKYTDFRQEGWRLEHTKPSEPASALAFKGVVFNEMKGVMSDPGAYFVTRLQQSLHPGSSYEHVSGGDPLHILDLTHAQLTEFHRRHYSPQNARFYTYGSDVDLPRVLTDIDATLTERVAYEKSLQLPPLPLLDVGHSTRFASPQFVHINGPIEPMGDPAAQVKASVAFLTNDITDAFTTFAMGVLSTLLTNDPSAPLHKALIDSQLGSDYAPGTGYSTDGRETSFAAGLQGLKSVDDAKKVEELVMNALRETAKKGLPQDQIDAQLHQMRLAIKHESASFGLNLGLNIAGSWVHGADALDMLNPNAYVDELEAKVKQGGFFEKLIEDQLLNNPHRLTFVVSGDANYAAEQAQLEADKLARSQAKLTSEDQAKIYDDGLVLQKLQDQKESLAVLPTLTMADVPPKTEVFPLTEKTFGGSTAGFIAKQPTNGLTYVRGALTLPDFPKDLLPYLPLYASALTWMGTTKRDREKYALEVARYTGGIDVSPSVVVNPNDFNKGSLDVFFSAVSLNGNIPRAIELLEDTLRNPSYADRDHLRNLIAREASSLSNSVADAGHNLAMKFAAAQLTAPMALSEQLSGMTQVEFMEQVAAQTDLDDVIAKLVQIHEAVIVNSTGRSSNTLLRLLVTAEDVSVETEGLLHSLAGPFSSQATVSSISPSSTAALSPNNINNNNNNNKTYFGLPVQVNFSSKAIRTVPLAHPDSVLLQIAARLMTNSFLHKEIREKNGAYGGGASAGGDGVFSFYSYRDPSSLKTVSVYDEAVHWFLRKGAFSDHEIDEAKLAVFGRIDAPVSPSDRGLTRFKFGITDEQRQQRRDVLRAATRADLVRSVEQHLATGADAQAQTQAQEQAQASVVLGTKPSDEFAAELKEKGWTVR